MNLNEVFKGLYGITCFQHSRGRTNEQVVLEMLEAGVKVIQYRDKRRPGKVKHEECVRLRKLTREHGAMFIVNDDVALALVTGADGVHLGQDDLPIAEARKLAGGLVIGVSTHCPEQALRAVADGADYIGAGPVFETGTKEDVCAPVGLEYIKYCRENIKVPFVAIGGIKEHNIDSVLAAGAECICLVTGITEAEDIGCKISALIDKMGRVQ